MVMSASTFTKNMHFEDFTKTINNIEKIIDQHLDWYTKQFQPTCDALAYPGYWVFGTQNNLIFEERRQKVDVPLYEKMVRGEALSIKANLVDHGNLQQQVIKQKIVNDYRNSGWHVYWGNDKNDKTREILIISLVEINE